MNRRLHVCIISLLLYILSVNAAASTTAGKPASDIVYKKLISNGFFPQKAALAPSESNDFPYNIILSFPSASSRQATDIDSKDTVIVVFSQYDAVLYFNEIRQLLEALRTGTYDVSIQVLLSADNSRQLPPSEITDGIQVFTTEIENASSVCAVTAGFSAKNTPLIIPGSGGDTSPEWLVRRLSRAFTLHKIPFDIRNGNILSMYRLGILKDDEQLSPFLSAGIPAAGILFTQPDAASASQVSEVLGSFLASYTPKNTVEWDRHYLTERIFGHRYWLKEPLTVSLFLVVTAVSLFILSGFSFLFGRNKGQHKKQVLQALYIIPVILILSGLSLHLGARISAVLTTSIGLSPVMQIAVKILFSFLCLTFLYLVEIQMHMSFSPYVYSYLQTLMSVLNIFVFTAFDLSLFFLFTAEYIVIYLLRPAKRFIALLFSMICMFLPFLPYIIQMLQYGDTETINNMIYCPLQRNFLLASGILPFQIMWLRILFRLQIRESLKGERKTVAAKRIAAGASFSLVVLFFVFAGISKLMNRYNLFSAYTTLSAGKAEMTGTPEPVNLSAAITDSTYLGLKTRKISVTSKLPALRYRVTVSGNGTVPVYDSVYRFHSESKDGSGYFILPDWPPEQLSISYTPATGSDSTVRITAFYEKEKNDRSPFISVETILLNTGGINSGGITTGGS
ncbi:MAG: hypothetical protein LKF96_08955 [Treponema sp.]|jgi:hypothetical protein|nr:hypothetical protein [Treponema sp.]